MSESFDVQGRNGRPARLDLVSGASQVDTINATLGTPYVVRLLDDGGDPVPGATVLWQVTSGGGTISPPTSVTDAAGRASARHTLGRDLGDQRVDAIVQAQGELRATFVTSVVHGAPASLLFTQQPVDTPEDERIQPAVGVTAIDRLGNRTTRSTAEVSISLVTLSGRREGRLRGETKRRLSNGTAVFDNLRIDRRGDFQLRAHLGSLTAESATFRVFDD